MMGIEELEDLSRVLQKTDVCSPLSVEANPIWYMLAHVKHVGSACWLEVKIPQNSGRCGTEGHVLVGIVMMS